MISFLKTNRLMLFTILIIGIVVRLINYFSNPGLWLDEALPALSLMERSFAQLSLPLDHNQVAPVLYLWIEKLAISAFGPGEMALRLFPLICSLLSLPLFYFVAKDLLKDEKPVLIALFIFALAPVQFRYAAEAKPYMIDLFTALLLIWLFLRYFREPGRRTLIPFAVAGIIAPFLSNTAVFILFSIGTCWIISNIRSKRFSISSFIVPALWLISFGLCYFIFIAGNKIEPFMLIYWKNNFVPLSPFSLAFWQFITTIGATVFYELSLYNDAGLPVPLNRMIIIILILGYISGLLRAIIKKNYKLTWFLFFPFILHFILSGFRIYPFATRFLLYLSPLLYISIAYGLSLLIGSPGNIKIGKQIGTIILIVVLAVFPFKAYKNLPLEIEGARDCIEYINGKYAAGQQVYVDVYASSIYEYYNRTGRVKWSDHVIPGKIKEKITGDKNISNWESDFTALMNNPGEYWLLFAHVSPQNRSRILMKLKEMDYLDNIKDSTRSKMSAAYLLDMNR